MHLTHIVFRLLTLRRNEDETDNGIDSATDEDYMR